MNIAVAEPAVHPSGLRVFARQINRRQRGFRKISATNRAAERVLTTPGPASGSHSDYPGRTPGLMMPRTQCTGEHAERIELTSGTNLAAVEALRTLETFNREQVAYLVALAYQVGRSQAIGEDLAEAAACWDENPTPKQIRGQRVAARMAEIERRVGPPRYFGGEVDWETGLPVGGAA